MDLQVLKYFYTVANEGSVLQASKKLGYAQPNLSSRMKQLESELGQELFIRTSGGISLTDKGRQLYAYAEKLLRLSEEAELAVKNEKAIAYELSIGAMESSAVSFLPPILSAFHRKHTDLSMKIRTANSRRLTEQVIRHELDGAFVSGATDHAELESIPVRRERLALVSDSALPESTALNELLRRPLLVFPVGCAYRRTLENLLEEKNIFPMAVFEFSSLGAVLSSASAGLGVSLLPEDAIKAFGASDALRCFSLPAPFDSADIRFVYRKGSANNLSLMGFVQEIRAYEV